MCGVVTSSSYHMDASARLLGTSSPVQLFKINIFSLSLSRKGSDFISSTETKSKQLFAFSPLNATVTQKMAEHF